MIREQTTAQRTSGAVLQDDPRSRLSIVTGASERRRRKTLHGREATFRRALALADVLTVAVVLWVGTIVLGDDGLTVATLGALVLLVLLMKLIGLYDRDENLLHKTTLDELPKLFQVATLSSLLLWLAGDVIVAGELGRRQIFGMWILLFVLLIVGRAFARFLATQATTHERCLMLGDVAAVDMVRQKLRFTSSVKAEVITWLPLAGNGASNGSPRLPELPPDLPEVLAEQRIDRVIVAPGHVDSDALLHLMRHLGSLDVRVSVFPATPAVPGSSVEPDDINGLTLLGVRGLEIGRSSRLLKRAFDLALSSVLLLLAAPLMLAIAVAVKLDSAGPVLFRQRRIGRHGTPFEMLKFRSMTENAHELRGNLRELNEAVGLFKIENDPRVTRVGRFIRRTSLDELPQLINVLRGEMAMVGPRPLVPEEDSMIEGHFRRRLDLTPGITGYWQALGSSRIPLSEMVRLDYLYVSSWSLWNDVRILLRTVPHVAGRRGR
jgi:exopolysaccharide biosynthesis polyprenyl glycosylphosphotransferase